MNVVLAVPVVSLGFDFSSHERANQPDVMLMGCQIPCREMYIAKKVVFYAVHGFSTESACRTSRILVAVHCAATQGLYSSLWHWH